MPEDQAEVTEQMVTEESPDQGQDYARISQRRLLMMKNP